MVVFSDAAGTRTPSSRRAVYERVLNDALALLRPPGELWTVTMVETAGMVRFDFVYGVDAPRSLTVAADSGDDELHLLVCEFVEAYWPSSGQPS